MFIVLTSLACLLAIMVSWLVVFTLFTSKSRINIGIAVAILIGFLSPSIIRICNNFCININRAIFVMGESGEVQLIAAPMKIPANYKGKGKDYCNKFTDGSGNPINVISYRDDGGYCGAYWNFYEKNAIFIPYKKLPNGKIKYWTAPELSIIDTSSGKINTSIN